jgi:hypothetical protein
MLELVLVLVAFAFLGLMLNKAFNKPVAKEKKIYFDVIDGMHRGKSVQELEDELVDKYDIKTYEAGLIVSAAIDGESDYAIQYISELLKNKITV